MNQCIFCPKEVIKPTEHVFPKGLGGGDVFVDFVCSDCNNRFSGIERELIQKSFVGFIRTAEGVQGYRKKKNNHPAALKYLDILYKDTNHSLIYECGVEAQLKPYFKPQIIKYTNEFITVASDPKDGELFQKHFQNWFDEPIIITKFPEKVEEQYESIRFYIDEHKKVHYSNEVLHKSKKHHIIYIPMEVEEYDNIFTPRVFLSADDRLYVRANSIAQSVEFITELVSYLLVNGKTSTPEGLPSTEVVQSPKLLMSFNFDLRKCNRAAAKILINTLLHFHPTLRAHPSLANIKKFIIDGDVTIKGGFTNKNIPYFKIPDCHQVLFTVEGNNLILYLSLFGAMNYVFVIEDMGTDAQKEIGILKAVSINYLNGEINLLDPS